MDSNNMGPLRSDELLEGMDWPQPRLWGEPGMGKNDCLVVCAGFEERSVEVLQRAVDTGANPARVVLITYRPSYEENRRDQLRRIARTAGVDLVEAVYDRRSPAGIGDRVAALVQGFEHVSVDVSGMSRFLIVQALVALLNRIGSLVVLYCEPAVYFPTKCEVDRDWAAKEQQALSYRSAGVFEVATDPALSSVAMPGAEIRLIVFPSFSPVQLISLVDELQPTYTDLVHGVRAKEEDRWREAAIRTLNRPFAASIQNCKEHSVSTFDYRDTIGLLLRLYRKRSMFDRLVVAPTGSKLQAVAVGLIRSVLYDVQVVYPTPRVFTEPRRYTKGVRRVYSADIAVEDVPNEEPG